MKRALSIILSLCMLFSSFAYALPVTENVESTTPGASTGEITSNVVYEWNFEDGTQGWVNSKNHGVNWENGKMVITHPTAGGYIRHGDESLGKAGIKYIVFNARATGGAQGFKFWFTNASGGFSDAGMFQLDMPDTATFENYVVNLSAYSEWSGNNYKNCMLQMIGAGETAKIEFESIKFLSELDAALIEDYVLDFEDGTVTGVTGFNNLNTLSVADGLLKINKVAGSGAGTYVTLSKALSTAEYRYLTLKVKKDISTMLPATGYFVRTDMSGISGDAGYSMTSATLTHPDGDYAYYIYDMSTLSGYTGSIQKFFFQYATGDLYIDEIRVSADLDFLPEANYTLDFENGTMTGISVFNDRSTCSVEDGVLKVTKTVNAGTGIWVALPSPVKAEDYSYFTLKVKDDVSTIAPTSAYFVKTDMSNISGETGYYLAGATSTLTDGSYTYYVYDVSSLAGYKDNIQKFLFQYGTTTGTVCVDEIIISGNLDFLPEAPTNIYKWDFEDGTYKGIGEFSKNNTVSAADGVLIVTYAANGYSGSGINAYPQKSIMAQDYPYLVLKNKQTSTTAPTGVFIQAGSMSGIEAGSSTSTNVKVSDNEAGYDYYIYDLSVFEKWTGAITRVVVQSGLGTYYVEELYFTNDVSDLTEKEEEEEPTAEIEKLAVYSSGNITTDRGTVTLNPYVRLSDGTEPKDFSDVYYITDSVNGQLTRNADGSATVTGQLNGELNVTVVMPKYDVTVTKTITISGQTERLAATNLKVFMFGNSIRQHGYHKEYWPWYDMRGMAASTKDKDYAHRFVYYMEQKFGEGSVDLIDTPQINPYERTIPGTAADFDFSEAMSVYIKQIEEQQPDIISLQMGENVEGATQAQFERGVEQLYLAMREAAPDAVIVVCTCFWAGDYKVKGMTNIANKYDIPLAELHPLNSEEYYARHNGEGWFLPETASNGVRIHPGDTGMDNIAQRIYEQVNIKLSEASPTVYTPAPASITITPKVAEITEKNGTLQLTATVLPEDAASDVVWSISNENIATIDETGLITALNNTNDEILTVTVKSKFVDTVQAQINVEISGQTPAYTVTYDGNADDVTNVPEPNTYAKEGFKFAKVYPERSTYKFIGWATTPYGDVVDTLDVTEDTTVYAQWTKARSWNFNREGFKEGFSADHAFNEYVQQGVYEAMATATNVEAGEVLKFKSPLLDLPADDYDVLTLRIKNSTFAANTVLKLTVKTTEGNVEYTAPVTSTEFTSYNFPLDGLDGTITGFEFVPTNIDCAVLIDNIAFGMNCVIYDANTTDVVENMPLGTGYPNDEGLVALSENIPTRAGYTFLGWSYKADSKLLIDTAVETSAAKPVTVYAVWDKNDHWEFDSEEEIVGVTNAENYSVNDGLLSITESAGSDDVIVTIKNPGKGLTVSPDMSMVYRAKHRDFSGDSLNGYIFYWTSATGTTGADGNYAAATTTVPKAGSSDGFVDYTIPFAAHPKFSGTLGGFRFDPFDNVTGTMEIDYLRFTDSDANIVTASGTARSLTYDDAVTHIVRKGGILAPVGGVEIKGLALTGDIDMTDGYITVTGKVEMEVDAPYVVYTLDASAVDGEALFISGYDGAVEIKDGAKYIVKTVDGKGYIYTGNADGTDKKVIDTVVKNPAAVSIEYNVTNAKIENSSCVFSFGVETSAAATATVMVALYNQNNRMVGFRQLPVTFENGLAEVVDLYVDFVETPHSYKIFLWKSLNSLAPVAVNYGSTFE